MNLGGVPNPLMDRGPVEGDNRESRPGGPFVHNGAMVNVDLSAVVGGMEANGVSTFPRVRYPVLMVTVIQIQRTPIINRTSGAFQQLWHQPQQFQERGGQRRQQFVQGDRPLRTATISERSDSVQEVEHLLGGGGNRTQMRMNPREGQWTNAGRTSYPTQQGKGLGCAWLFMSSDRYYLQHRRARDVGSNQQVLISLGSEGHHRSMVFYISVRVIVIVLHHVARALW